MIPFEVSCLLDIYFKLIASSSSFSLNLCHRHNTSWQQLKTQSFNTPACIMRNSGIHMMIE